MPIVNWPEVADGDSVPKGCYQVAVRKATRKVSKANSLMVEVQYRISLPEKYRGLTLFDRFVIGEPGEGDTDQWGWLDDDEIDPTMFGARLLKGALKAAHIPLAANQLGADLEAFVGQEIMVDVENSLNDEGKPRANVRGHWAIGERQPHVDEDTSTTQATVRLSQRPRGAARTTV